MEWMVPLILSLQSSKGGGLGLRRGGVGALNPLILSKFRRSFSKNKCIFSFSQKENKQKNIKPTAGNGDLDFLPQSHIDIVVPVATRISLTCVCCLATPEELGWLLKWWNHVWVTSFSQEAQRIWVVSLTLSFPCEMLNFVLHRALCIGCLRLSLPPHLLILIPLDAPDSSDYRTAQTPWQAQASPAQPCCPMCHLQAGWSCQVPDPSQPCWLGADIPRRLCLHETVPSSWGTVWAVLPTYVRTGAIFWAPIFSLVKYGSKAISRGRVVKRASPRIRSFAAHWVQWLHLPKTQSTHLQSSSNLVVPIHLIRLSQTWAKNICICFLWLL